MTTNCAITPISGIYSQLVARGGVANRMATGSNLVGCCCSRPRSAFATRRPDKQHLQEDDWLEWRLRRVFVVLGARLGSENDLRCGFYSIQRAIAIFAGHNVCVFTVDAAIGAAVHACERSSGASAMIGSCGHLHCHWMLIVTAGQVQKVAMGMPSCGALWGRTSRLPHTIWAPRSRCQTARHVRDHLDSSWSMLPSCPRQQD